MTATRPAGARAAEAWDAAAEVVDPEVPVLTIADLGVLRSVVVVDGTAVVEITPTYSGCPAMDTITSDVRAAVARAGFEAVEVRVVLTPAWTTEWMSETGREKLREFGIAPPTGTRAPGPVPVALSVRCPQCGSANTRELSRFGSTSCKALWQCHACAEPFDHFKDL